MTPTPNPKKKVSSTATWSSNLSFQTTGVRHLNRPTPLSDACATNYMPAHNRSVAQAQADTNARSGDKDSHEEPAKSLTTTLKNLAKFNFISQENLRFFEIYKSTKMMEAAAIINYLLYASGITHFWSIKVCLRFYFSTNRYLSDVNLGDKRTVSFLSGYK